MLLNEIERIVCVCLDKRLSEWEQLEKQFTERGAEVDRFIVGKGNLLSRSKYDHIDSDVVGPQWQRRSFTTGAFHAHQSHRKILQKAYDDKVSSILLLEDDCLLRDDFDDALNFASDELSLLNIRPDTLHLGVNITWGEASQASKHLLKLNKGAYCWHCVWINGDMIEHFLALPETGPFDFLHATEIQPKFNCYAVWPTIAYQQPCFSSVNNTYVDYTKYFTNVGKNKIE